MSGLPLAASVRRVKRPQGWPVTFHCGTVRPPGALSTWRSQKSKLPRCGYQVDCVSRSATQTPGVVSMVTPA